MTIKLREHSHDEIPAILNEWWQHGLEHGLLCDAAIEQFIKIEPLYKGPSPAGKVSYGLSSYGYDIRVGHKFKIFTNVYGAVVDPKAMRPEAFVNVDLSHQFHDWVKAYVDDPEVKEACARCGEHKKGNAFSPCLAPDHIVIPPNSFALAESVEYIEVPREVLVVGIGKSTYARCGIILNVTPLEPEWRGKITLEISNTTPLPAKIYANEGICQLLFFKTPIECLTSYLDKKGRYQDQKGLTLPFVS